MDVLENSLLLGIPVHLMAISTMWMARNRPQREGVFTRQQSADTAEQRVLSRELAAWHLQHTVEKPQQPHSKYRVNRPSLYSELYLIIENILKTGSLDAGQGGLELTALLSLPLEH